MAKKDEPDTTPTKLTHAASGSTVYVPAHKVDARVASGLFEKPAKSSGSKSEK